jgi:hypothetical protein
MGYRDAVRDATGDARRELLEAALVLGDHLDDPEGGVDDETIVGSLSAFMDARERYLVSLGAKYGASCDTVVFGGRGPGRPIPGRRRR